MNSGDISATESDATGTTAMHMRVKSSSVSELTSFTLQLRTTEGYTKDGRQGTYSGVVEVPANGEWVDVSMAWSKFTFGWRGRTVEGPALETQLGRIQQLGVGTS